MPTSSSEQSLPPKNTPQWHLQEAERLKDAGNTHYGDKSYPSAIKQYHLCLLQVRAVQNQMKMSGSSQSLSGLLNGPENNNDQQMSPDEKVRVRKEADTLAVKCYNNLAACILNGEKKRKQEDYLRAVGYCDKVLEIEPDNEKAHFRKGKALCEAGEQEKAVEAFKETLKLKPENQEAKAWIARCQREIDLDRKQRDEIIKQNFQRAQAREASRQANVEHAATSNGDMAHPSNGDESAERLLPK